MMGHRNESFVTEPELSFSLLMHHTYICKLSVRHELDNVSGDWFSSCWPKHTVISIQKLHGLKVSWSYPRNNDWHGESWCPNDGVPRLVKVSDLAISEDQQDKVLLQRQEDTCQS